LTRNSKKNFEKFNCYSCLFHCFVTLYLYEQEISDFELAKVLQEEEYLHFFEAEDIKLVESLLKDKLIGNQPTEHKLLSTCLEHPNFVLNYYIPNWKKKLESDFKKSTLRV
jgi:hypothetical protein